MRVSKFLGNLAIMLTSQVTDHEIIAFFAFVTELAKCCFSKYLQHFIIQSRILYQKTFYKSFFVSNRLYPLQFRIMLLFPQKKRILNAKRVTKFPPGLKSLSFSQ